MKTIDTINYYPLSLPQKEIWFDQVLRPEVPLYNIGGYIRIDGPVDPARLEKALNQVIGENDALRIMIVEKESTPTQVFAENVHLKLDYHDFSNKENAHQQVLEWMEREFAKPFQLYNELLFQYGLFKISTECYYGFYKCHHLIVDGWGIALMVQRLTTAYNALTNQQTHPDRKCYSYLDFVKGDQVYLDSKKFAKAKHYWLEKYREVPEPLMAHRYAAQFQGKTIPSQRSILHLNRSLYNQLIDFAKENNVSIFHVILGVLYCYFVRTGNREDLAVGLATLNRSSAAFKQTLGSFVGVTPAWFRFGTDLSFVELIQAIRGELQEDYRYQRFPVSEINRQTSLYKEGRWQLFDITLSYAKHDYDINFNGSPARAIFFNNGFEQTGLALFIEEFHQHGDVNLDFDYSLGAFDADEIELLKARFKFIFGEILRRPNISIRKLQIMPDEECQKILFEFNDTAADYPHDKTIVNLFEEQVEKTPLNIAVVFENQQLTYQELNSRANQLAHYLQSLGVKPEVLVGICVERSLEMIIGLLAILKAGGAYVPLDPTYPPARLAFMLEDANAPVLLTQSSLKKGLPETTTLVICLDTEAETFLQLSTENPSSVLGPENLVYVIYTSGSTGKPKGVCTPHKAVSRLVKKTDYIEFSAEHTFLQLAPLPFDASTLEIWGSLLNGSLLVLMPPQQPSLIEIGQALQRHQVTTLWLTAGLFHMMLDNCLADLCKLKQLLAGGEVLSIEAVKKALHELPACRLINGYGPTENTTFTTCCVINEAYLGDTVPIGKPIANTQVYVLDTAHQPVPLGVVGELCAAGAGLACGYLNRPELTKERFIEVEILGKIERIYKTGDLARWRPDGNLEYLGRIDHQVKLRGFRIELGEIEAVLNQNSMVQEAVVMVHEEEPGNKHLVAYIVSKLVLERLPIQSICQVESDNNPPIELRTEDISCGGVGLSGIPQTCKKGHTVRVQIPDIFEELWLEGKVAWCKEQRGGVQFTLNSTKQEQVCETVEELFETQGFVKAMQRSAVSNMRATLKEKLPSYMMPSSFVFLNDMPRTPNGKIDRKALLNFDKPFMDDTGYVAPQTEIEQKIATVWQQVLHINKVGIHDNFFDLGGNSLLAVQIHKQLVGVLNQDMQIITLFQHPTINTLAHYLNESLGEPVALSSNHYDAQRKTAARHRHYEHHKKEHLQV